MKSLLLIAFLMLLSTFTLSAQKKIRMEQARANIGRYVQVEEMFEGIRVINPSQVYLSLGATADSAVTVVATFHNAMEKIFPLSGKVGRINGRFIMVKGMPTLTVTNINQLQLANCNCLRGEKDADVVPPEAISPVQQVQLDSMLHHIGEPNNPGIPLSELVYYDGHDVYFRDTIAGYLTTSSKSTELYFGSKDGKARFTILIRGEKLNRKSLMWWQKKKLWYFRGVLLNSGTYMEISSLNQMGVVGEKANPKTP